MKHPKLKLQTRSVLGKKVKKLRREGILPVNLYGKNIPSVSLQLPLAEFETVFKEVGETGLIDLEVEGKSRPSLVKNVQWNHRTHTPLHIDFYQVNLKEKVKTMVPLTLTDEAKAVTENVGMLMQQISEVEVEALPEKLPDHITLSVAHLSQVGEQITVADLPKPEGAEILTDPGQIIVSIAELVAPEPEPEPEAEAEITTDEEQSAEEAGETKETGDENAQNKESTEDNKPEEKPKG